MKYLMAIVFLGLSSLAQASGLGFALSNGFQGAQREQEHEQWMAMSQAWIDCMKQGGGASCGPAPEQPQQQYQPVQQYQPPQPKPQFDTRVTDFGCVNKCVASGNMYGLCKSRCSW